MNQVVNHPNFKSFLLYCISLTVLGCAITGLGPMFPYMSDADHRLQTEYSFLFLCRAMGYIIGSLSVKIIEKYLNFHQSLCLGVGLPGVTLLFFSSFSDLNVKGLIIFIASLGCALVDIFTNVATLASFKGKNLAIWLQILHGAFGIGGLIGPFIVYLFELQTMTIISLLFLILIPLYCRIKSPQQKNQQDKPLQDILNPPQTQTKKISTFSNYLIACIFFFVVGQESTFGGWVSSYSVLQGFSSREHATMYSSVYWISITFFRITLAFVGGKASFKINVLFMIAILQTFLSLFLIYEVNPEFGLVTSALVFGLSNSVLFPLLLLIPQQMGLQVSAGQNSNFMLFSFLGEGTLSVITGYSMKIISYDCFWYSMGLINLLGICMHIFAVKKLHQQSKHRFRVKHYQSYELVDAVRISSLSKSSASRLKIQN